MFVSIRNKRTFMSSNPSLGVGLLAPRATDVPRSYENVHPLGLSQGSKHRPIVGS